MSPDPFDELDQALSSGLSALAPEVVGGDSALASMRPRFERARRRRRVAQVGASVAALVVLGSVAVLAAPGPSRSHVNVTSPPTTPGHTRPKVKHHHATTSSTVPVKRTTTTSTTAPPTSSTSKSTGHTSPPPPPTSPLISPPTTPGTTGDNHGPGSTTTVPHPDDIHFAFSHGGTIKYSFSHGVLRLLHVSPAHGYAAHVKDGGGDKIDVVFTDAGHPNYEIKLQVNGGHLDGPHVTSYGEMSSSSGGSRRCSPDPKTDGRLASRQAGSKGRRPETHA